jgi:D-alanine-D-alanine ligase
LYRREPEWLYGEGIGSSRAPLVALLWALGALKRVKRLRNIPLGVLYYADEGHDCRYSADLIQKTVSEVQQVLVLRPGNVGDHFVTTRRGQRRYRVCIDGEPAQLGKRNPKRDVLNWTFEKLQACAGLSSRKERVAVSAIDLETAKMPMLLPHHVTATLLVSFPDNQLADQVESEIRNILANHGRISSRLELVSNRAPMNERRASARLAKSLESLAAKWEIPLQRESSVWPSVAGLVPPNKGVVCGIGPVARDVYTPDESVDRISLMQRTILLAEFLNQTVRADVDDGPRRK